MKKLIVFFLILISGSVLTIAQVTGSGTALDFSGGDKNVEFPDDPSLNPTSQISIEAWINSYSWGINAWTNNIVNKEDWAVIQEGYTLRCGDNGKISFMFSGGGIWRELITAPVMQLNTWYHVVGTFDGDSINVYLNGEYIGTELYSGPMTPGTYPLRIGMLSYAPGGPRAFDGMIDEVRIWNTALDISTIRDWMCKKITPSHPDYANLIAYFKLDEGSGNTVYDSSPNNNTGTLNAGPTWVNSGAYIGDESVHSYTAPYDLSLDYNGADSMVVDNVTGDPAGIHLISFDGSQNALNFPATYNGIDTSHYWGVFMFGGISPAYDLNYYYGGGSLSGACGLGMLGRLDNTVILWTDLNASHNISAQTLTKNLNTKQEISIGFTGAASIYTSDPTAFCDGDSAVLIADSALSYQWLNGGIPIQGANNIKYTAKTTGSYSLIAVVGSCTDTSQAINITVYPIPNADAGPDKTICPGSNVALTASGGAAYVWSTNPPQTNATIIVSPTTQTTYYVTVVQNICIAIDSVTVFMSPLVNLGADTTINPGTSIILNAGSNFLSYLWSDGSVGQYLTVNAAGTYWVNATYPGGCLSSDTIVISVGYKIEGNIAYKNTYNTPISNTKLLLKDDLGNTVDSVLTDANGNYMFSNLMTGQYYINPQCNKPWGGVNSTDALAAMKHFVGLIYLYGINAIAGDVDKSLYVNSADALMIQKRYINLINSFPAGDWVFENDLLPLQGVSVVNDFYGLCYGDVNGTYVPPLNKQSSMVSIENKNTLYSDPYEIIELPVVIKSPLNVAAISLELIYPDNLVSIEDVCIAGFTNENLLFKADNGVLRISWYSLEGLYFSPDDVIMKIYVRINKEADLLNNPILFEPGVENEFAGPETDILNEVKLNIPEIIINKNSLGNYLGYIHPNPATGSADIEYGLQESGFVQLTVYNMLGEEIAALVNKKQKAGNYNVRFITSGLRTGNYFYSLRVSGINGVFSKSRVMQIR